MPIYEYQCESCQHRFEKLVFSEKDEKEISCPKCNSKQIKRIMSASAAGFGCVKTSGGFS
ncbi:MAG TPA: zinc ribbon domain-containing protein [Desulfobacterales bacterium]|nr:zinc ribbon domain-containing protein [Desulfobacterales bacterium]